MDFRNLTLCPFGVTSTFSRCGVDYEYAAWIRGKAILFQWRVGASASIDLMVREGFLTHCNEESQWDEPEFDQRLRALRYNLRYNFTPETRRIVPTRKRHEACSMIGSLLPAEHLSDAGVRRLRVRVTGGQTCRFAVTFGEDVRQVEWLLRDAWRDWDAWLAEQMNRYTRLAQKVPQVTVPGEGEGSPLSEIIRTGPLFVESARRVKDGCQVAMRASTRGYGLWNGWDGQWGCMVLNACDSQDTVPKYLNFLDAQRGPNGAIPFVADYDFGPIHDQNLHTPEMDRPLGDGYHINHEMWGLANLHQYYFRTRDRGVLEKLYPNFARSLREIHSNASHFGLVGSCFGGADHPGEANRPSFDDPMENCTQTSRLSGADDMGALYNGCILGAELAAIMDDRRTLRGCVEIVRRLDRHYLPLFLDAETGFLIDAVWWKDNPAHRNPFHRLTVLLALQGYGEQLLLGALDALAGFVRNRMVDPRLGLRDVPKDHPDLPAYRRWEDHWLQNATKETLKLARLAGDRELLDVQVDAILRNFQADKTIHEDLYVAQKGGRYKPQELYQSTSWWQCMTVHAWWNGLIESVAGLRYERGQLEYFPGDSGRDVSLRNFHWAGRCWSMDVAGHGRWIDRMTVNGRPVQGTYQIAPSDQAAEQQIVITKTDSPAEYPVILSAGAVPVTVQSVAKGLLKASLASPGFVRLHFSSPARPCLRVNGESVEIGWSRKRREGIASILTAGDLHVTLDCR